MWHQLILFNKKMYQNYFVLLSDPVPTARRGTVIPVPDLEEESLWKENLAPVTAGPVPLPANPSLALILASPGLIQQNASPVQRVVPRWSQSVIPAVDPRRTAKSRSFAVVRNPQWGTGRKNGRPNLHRAHHPQMKMPVAPSQGKSDQPHAQSHAQSHVQGLVHGQDQLLRIRGCMRREPFLSLSLISMLSTLSCVMLPACSVKALLVLYTGLSFIEDSQLLGTHFEILLTQDL